MPESAVCRDRAVPVPNNPGVSIGSISRTIRGISEYDRLDPGGMTQKDIMAVAAEARSYPPR